VESWARTLPGDFVQIFPLFIYEFLSFESTERRKSIFLSFTGRALE